MVTFCSERKLGNICFTLAVLTSTSENSVCGAHALLRAQAGKTTAMVSSHLHFLHLARCEGNGIGLQPTHGKRKTITSDLNNWHHSPNFLLFLASSWTTFMSPHLYIFNPATAFAPTSAITSGQFSLLPSFEFALPNLYVGQAWRKHWYKANSDTGGGSEHKWVKTNQAMSNCQMFNKTQMLLKTVFLNRWTVLKLAMVLAL